jgi:hypothetical protein
MMALKSSAKRGYYHYLEPGTAPRRSYTASWAAWKLSLVLPANMMTLPAWRCCALERPRNLGNQSVRTAGNPESGQAKGLQACHSIGEPAQGCSLLLRQPPLAQTHGFQYALGNELLPPVLLYPVAQLG